MLMQVFCLQIGGHSAISKNHPSSDTIQPHGSNYYPEEIIKFTKEYYKIIDSANGSKNVFQISNIKSDCIYHGVDVNIYRP